MKTSNPRAMQTQHDRAKLLWNWLLAIRNHLRNLQAMIPNRCTQLYHLVTSNAGRRSQVIYWKLLTHSGLRTTYTSVSRCSSVLEPLQARLPFTTRSSLSLSGKESNVPSWQLQISKWKTEAWETEIAISWISCTTSRDEWISGPQQVRTLFPLKITPNLTNFHVTLRCIKNG